MSYLISISIGPVQEFIASARRSRDLWFGSWLLSELSKAAAKEIVTQGGELIFPNTKEENLEPNTAFNVVNKILAIVEILDKKNFGDGLRNRVDTRLEEIYADIFKEIKRKLGKHQDVFFEKEATAQIKDMYELYWAAIRFDKSEISNDNYKKCRERVEILLNGRKTARDFKKVTWGSEAPKSSLDGWRESVILDKRIDDLLIQRVFNLRKAERLCGVGVLKRLAEKDAGKNFASTSHLASLPLLETLENTPENIKAVEDYIRNLTDLIFQIDDSDLGKISEHLYHPVFQHYDGHLLFESRLKDLPFEGVNLEKAQIALEDFKSAVFKDKTKKPLPYFALLQADGDWMGSVIDNQNHYADHQELSKALSEFAGKVKDIVKKYKGCLIYAGGDDVLAMLPLHTVLGCARELTDVFSKKLSQNSKFVDENGNPPTLSAGIAIVHHTEPLQESLETMRRAEKEAKAVSGKNALAIISSKRSGADTIIKGSWTDDFDKRLKWFIQLHLDDGLPDGAAYELRDLWFRFKNITTLEKAMLADANRILRRKYSNQGTTKVSREILDKIENLIGNQETSLRDLKDKLSLEELFNEIIVAKDFAAAFKQAGIENVGGIE